LIISSDVVMTACFNIDTASIDITILGGVGPFTYDWSDDLVDQEDQENLMPGEYSLMVTDLNGCETEETFNIEEPDTLTVSLFSPIRVFPDFNISEFMGNDGAIEATVEGGTPEYSFVWTGEDGFTAFSQDVTGLTAGQYCLVVTDSMGCVWDQCLELTEPLVLTLPNGMSPNGDGQNDGLEIQGIEGFPNNTVQVFNRWGNSVFEQNNYNNQNQWQGEGKNGNELPDGTYFVLLRVNDKNIELSGYLELRR
jgi:gliding motility-associated-like protein